MLGSELTLIAVGTPFDGKQIDLSRVRRVAREVGEALRDKGSHGRTGDSRLHGARPDRARRDRCADDGGPRRALCSVRDRTEDPDEPATVGLLLARNVSVKAYDPVAIPQARTILGSTIAFAQTLRECFEDVDAVVLLTRWKQFESLAAMLDGLKSPPAAAGRPPPAG